MDPKSLYNEMLVLENELRELIRSNPLQEHQLIQNTRNKLMDKAKLLVHISPLYAASKEMEQILWKPCFYKRIEEFRGRIRKYATASTKDPTLRDHFRQITYDFQQFLTTSLEFYQHIKDTLWKYVQTSYGTENTMRTLEKERESLRSSLVRCFIFLGDLARYRELHSQKNKKNFALAESYYHQALIIAPWNGNPHNQLAVLATYIDAELVAVYRYSRSLLVRTPFLTAEENLTLLFERSRQRVLPEPSDSTGHGGLISKMSSKEKNIAVKSLLHRITRIHGQLFALSSTSTNNSTYQIATEALVVIDFEKFLRAGAIADAVFLKLVVIQILLCERSREKISKGFDLEETEKSNAFHHSVRLSLTLITIVLSTIAHPSDLSTGKPKGNTSTSSTSYHFLRLLGPIAVFCEYLHLHPTVFKNYIETDNITKTWPKFLTQLTKVVNLAEGHEMDGSKTPTNDKIFGVLKQAHNEESMGDRERKLKEAVELSGFVPLETPTIRRAEENAWLKAGALETEKRNKYVSDAEAIIMRLAKLQKFCSMLTSTYPYLSVNAIGALVVTSDTNSDLLHEPQVADLDFIDDDDDEVIVYQPSPVLGPSNPAPTYPLAPPAMSLPPIAPIAPLHSVNAPVQPVSTSSHNPQLQSRLSSGSIGSGISSGYGSNTFSGSLSPFSSFDSFPNFNNSSALSQSNGPEQSRLLSAWTTKNVNNSPIVNSNTTPSWLAAVTSPSTSTVSNISDLAAVEQASELYESTASTLSAILPTPSSSASRPPPGFAPSLGINGSSTNVWGFQPNLSNQVLKDQKSTSSTAFFNRSPYIAPYHQS